MSTDRKTSQILSALGDFAGKLGPIVGGPAGIGMIGAAAVAKGVARLLDAGSTVDEVLSRMRTVPALNKPWHEEPATMQETPAAKKKEP